MSEAPDPEEILPDEDELRPDPDERPIEADIADVLESTSFVEDEDDERDRPD